MKYVIMHSDTDFCDRLRHSSGAIYTSKHINWAAKWTFIEGPSCYALEQSWWWNESQEFKHSSIHCMLVSLRKHTESSWATGKLFSNQPQPLTALWRSSREKRFFQWESYYIVTCTVSLKVAYGGSHGLQQYLYSWRIAGIFFFLWAYGFISCHVAAV